MHGVTGKEKVCREGDQYKVKGVKGGVRRGNGCECRRKPEGWRCSGGDEGRIVEGNHTEGCRME